jgi:DNA-binding transcriptional ArsR family regulator
MGTTMLKAYARTATTQDEQAAALLWLFGSPIRMCMLRTLLEREGTITVDELAGECSRRQPTISNHLRYFEAKGFVAGRKDGNYMYYTVYRERIRDAIAVLNNLLDINKEN